MKSLPRKNLDSFCRSCLSELKKRKCNLQQMQNLSKLILVCTSLSVDKNDGYPKFLCQCCYDKLRLFHDFRVMALRSQRILAEVVAAETKCGQETCLIDDEELQKALAIQEQTEILNDIYGKRDWLDFDLKARRITNSYTKPQGNDSTKFTYSQTSSVGSQEGCSNATLNDAATIRERTSGEVIKELLSERDLITTGTESGDTLKSSLKTSERIIKPSLKSIKKSDMSSSSHRRTVSFEANATISDGSSTVIDVNESDMNRSDLSVDLSHLYHRLPLHAQNPTILKRPSNPETTRTPKVLKPKKLRPFKCPLADMESRSSILTKKFFNCGHCNRVFLDENILKAHLRTHSSYSSASSERNKTFTKKVFQQQQQQRLKSEKRYDISAKQRSVAKEKGPPQKKLSDHEKYLAYQKCLALEKSLAKEKSISDEILAYEKSVPKDKSLTRVKKERCYRESGGRAHLNDNQSKFRCDNSFYTCDDCGRVFHIDKNSHDSHSSRRQMKCEQCRSEATDSCTSIIQNQSSEISNMPPKNSESIHQGSKISSAQPKNACRSQHVWECPSCCMIFRSLSSFNIHRRNLLKGTRYSATRYCDPRISRTNLLKNFDGRRHLVEKLSNRSSFHNAGLRSSSKSSEKQRFIKSEPERCHRLEQNYSYHTPAVPMRRSSAKPMDFNYNY